MILRVILILTLAMLSQKQIDVIREPLHDYNILSGVTGSAKTYVTNLKWYELICNAPENSKFIQSGNTEGSLWDNITSPLLEIDRGIGWLSYKGIANKMRIIVNHTGTQVVCTGANTENAKDRIQGKSVKGWYGDEIVKQPRSFVEMASSRCREVVNGIMVRTPIIWTCNPDSPSHYIKTNYIDNLDMDVRNWFFGFFDNPTITQEFIDKLKKEYSGVFYQRMILGLWTTAEGQIYDKFEKSVHVVDTIPVDRIKEYVLGIDWGYESHMAILLIGITGDKQYYICDEMYVRHQLIDKSLVIPWTNVSHGYADSSRPEYIVQFKDVTGITIYPALNDVVEGIQEVQKGFVLRDNGEYGLYIHSKCVNTIKEIENYRWKQNKEGVGKDEPIKEKDHAMDSMRYVVYSRKSSFDYSTLPDISIKHGVSINA